MLDDDLGDRTMPATERHRREVRQRGEVARSSQLTAAISLFAASLLFWTMASEPVNHLTMLMRSGLSSASPKSLTIDSTMQLMNAAVHVCSMVVLPVGALMLLSGFLGNIAQVGWLWVPSAITPRSPKIVSLFSWDRTAEATGSMLRLALFAGITFHFVASRMSHFRSTGLTEPATMIFQPLRWMGELSIQLSLCGVVLAFVDYGYRFWRHEQRLKMTVEERRREQREDAIDPRIKQQRAVLVRRHGSPTLLSEIGPVSGTND